MGQPPGIPGDKVGWPSDDPLAKKPLPQKDDDDSSTTVRPKSAHNVDVPRISEVTFVVVYDGPATDSHEMDAVELATSLLALSAMFKRIQEISAPGEQPVSLNAQALVDGSFEVHLALIQPGVLNQILDFLTGDPATAVVNAGELLSMATGLFMLLKRFRGRRIRKIEAVKAGRSRVTLEDGATIEVDDRVLKAAQDQAVRREVERTIRPLKRRGMDSFRIRKTKVEGEPPLVEVTQEEAEHFDAPSIPDEPAPVVTSRVTLVQPVGVEFDWRQWRVTEGDSKVNVRVEDLDFRQRVDLQEITIGKNDLLRVEMETEQSRDNGGALKARHTITRVLEHIEGARQDPLDCGE